jgi:hypothetical protein
MNNIPQKQLEQKQIDRLAAVSQLYGDAKKILGLQMILSVPVVIFLSLLNLQFRQFEVYLTLWGGIVLLLDAFLMAPQQQKLQKEAAIIQELFDCDVLEMRWHEVTAGKPPTIEDIFREASKFQRHFKPRHPARKRLENWYPISVGQLPVDMARLICQRANCWWDAALRRRYALWSLIVLVSLSITMLLFSLVGGLTIEKFCLTVLAPLLPAIQLGWRLYSDHTESANNLDRLRDLVEDLWKKSLYNNLPPEEILKASRDLQDEIYNHRRKSPVIFNWIYQCLRNAREEEMNKGAEDFVAEAQGVLKMV